ncbi:MAG: trypsin-like peptidase domain-containing protein [Planctomycetota bacterium]|jgi:S1-C subfamily serine protease
MRRINSYGPSLIVLVTAAVVLLAGPAAVRRISYAYTDATIIQASQRLDSNTILEQINQAYRDLAAMVEPSVVHISTEQLGQDRWGQRTRRASSGSGWVFDADGHIVTNHHVIEDAERIEVQLHTGIIREAEIVGSDPTTDIALLKIAPGQLHPASRRLDADGEVAQGDLVFAFGSPFDFRFSMSSGVISGKGRSVGVIRDAMGRGYENFIQVDAAINPGNSGGPLTDARGRVIGMNTAIATGRRTPGSLDDGQFAGIGLAIPVEMIEPVVRQLIDTGEVNKGYLGLTVVDRENVVADELRLLELSFGLMVGAIDDGHPAMEEGLQVGDIVTHIDRTRVASRQQVLNALAKIDDDEDVELGVWRFEDAVEDGARTDIRVPVRSLRRLRGVSLLQAGDTIGELFDLEGHDGRGVRVATLVEDGPALRSGLRRGDIITHVNGEMIQNVPQLRSVISSMLPGSVARLDIWRFDDERGRGEELEIRVPLAQLDDLRTFGTLPEQQRRDRVQPLGIERMSTCTRELAREYDVDFHSGVLLEALVDGSPLAEEVPAGSIIVEVAEEPISDVDEFIDALRGRRLQAPFGIQVTVILPDGKLIKQRLQAAG